MNVASAIGLSGQNESSAHDLAVTVHTPSRLDASTRAAWDALAEEQAAFFMKPDVFDAWRDHLSGDQDPMVLLAKDSEDLVGAMPLVRARAWRGPGLGVRYDYDPQDTQYLTLPPRKMLPVRQISPVLSMPGTFGGPVALLDKTRANAVRHGFAAALADLGAWDMALLPLPEQEIGPWQSALSKVGLRSDVQHLNRSAVSLDPACQVAAVIAGQSKKARQNFRRSYKAAEAAALTLHTTRDPQEIMASMATVAAASWKATGRADQNANVPYHGRQQAFFEAMLAGPNAEQFIAVLARKDGAPVAIILSAVVGRTLTTLLTFWNGEVPAASPGVLVVAEAIDWAVANGLERVDFNSNSPLAARFANRTDTCENLLVYGSGRWGKTLRCVRTLAMAARPALRST